MQRIETIAVVGLGYVGLPLVLLADRKGYAVIGIDIDEKKIQDLTECNSYIDDVANDDLKNSSAQWTLDPKIISNAQAVIICVPTPVNHDKTPDLSPVKGAVKMIAPHLVTGTLVVLESTVNPGYLTK